MTFVSMVEDRRSEVVERIVNGVLQELFQGVAACNDLDLTRERLRRWMAARPKLRIGQSPYAQALLWQVIRATHKVLEHLPDSPSAAEMQSELDGLYALLSEDPPPLPPSLCARGFSFCPTPYIL